jgi:hypothetical protein
MSGRLASALDTCRSDESQQDLHGGLGSCPLSGSGKPHQTTGLRRKVAIAAANERKAAYGLCGPIGDCQDRRTKLPLRHRMNKRPLTVIPQ